MIKRLLFGISLGLLVVWFTWTQVLDGVRGSEEEAVSAESAASQVETSAMQPPVLADTSGYESILAEYGRLPMGERWASDEQAHRWMLRWAVDNLEPCVAVTGLTLTADGPEYPETGDWAVFSISVEVAPMDRESGRLIFSRLREQASSGRGMRLTSFEWASSSSEMRARDPDGGIGEVDSQDDNPSDSTAGEQEWHWDCVASEQVDGLLDSADEPACKLERVVSDPERSLLAALRPERFINPPDELRAPPPKPVPVVVLGLDDEADGEGVVEEDWGCVSMAWTYEQVVRLPPLEGDGAARSADAA